MRTSARQTRENRTITVDFQHEATYFQLLGDGKAFVELVIAFVMSLGFGSVTKRLLSRTASKAHGSSSWHGLRVCASALPLGGQCHFPSPRVLHS